MVDKSHSAKGLKIAAVIPARMSSTRFPGKPMSLIAGLPMIEHVRLRTKMNRSLSEVVVATCDEEIKKAVEAGGGKAVMTSDRHERCTDRVAEAAALIDADVIINVQGDVPMIDPGVLDLLIEPFLRDKDAQCVDLIAPILTDEEFNSPNVVKIVTDRQGNAIYYSREPIPSSKKAPGSYKKFKQLGIIAFSKDFLEEFTDLEPTPLEKIESVDMLRAVEHGFKIMTAVTTSEIRGVDTKEDLERASRQMESDPLVKEYLNVKRRTK